MNPWRYPWVFSSCSGGNAAKQAEGLNGTVHSRCESPIFPTLSDTLAVARSPVLYVIAGPNGAGKTTFAREFLPAADVVEFLNADLLAAGLSPLRPAMMAIRSARLLLSRWRELLTQRRDFAFESTLSGRTYAGMLREARAAGYEVRVCYLWLPSVALSLRRVRQRVFAQ